ncbi:cytochrome oxidase assembly protein 1 [Coemansia linderi]|uniref:Cytochrome oxidase assembly protein 1 n=1 Tax=Coemansia linderi TaxID=2663919 RepID=A0ACC1KA81_9FUNG|nr:cytochrome oxidase assembly protein 1 [Coemansia linderi]
MNSKSNTLLLSQLSMALARSRTAARSLAQSRSYSSQVGAAAAAAAATPSALQQKWESAHAKNPAFAVERDLPAPKNRKREIGLFLVFATITWGGGSIIAFNYQRMTSTPVTAALFTARHNDQVREVLGSQLNFTSSFPWISGDISHLKGFVEVEFDVVGDKGVPGRLVLKSRRTGKQNGEWTTTEFYIVMADGRKIDCDE